MPNAKAWFYYRTNPPTKGGGKDDAEFPSFLIQAEGQGEVIG